MKFKDTHLCSPAANFYAKHGVYTKLVEGTKDYYDFWDEEKRRCLEGYITPNDIQITGYHYFYLNYFRIDRSVTVIKNGRESKKREFLQPRFYDGDYEFFWLVDIARYGIEPNKLKQLHLTVDIHPNDLSGGKSIIVLKARRKGYSYKMSAMLTRNYFFVKRSKNYAFAFDKKYLSGDGIYQKFLDGMAFIDGNTPFIQPRVVDKAAALEMKSGYIINENGTNIVKGTQSYVAGISLKDNPDGARGKAGELNLFEEMGKFPGLEDAWNITEHTVYEGDEALGMMIGFGTGGTGESDFSGAEQLFFNPEEHHCIRINNKWDEGANGTWCGYFVPVYKNLPGFMDEDGNSDEQEAIEYELKARDRKKKSKKTNAYSQHIAELPFNPREAVLSFDMNLLPTAELVEQLNNVEVKKRWATGVPGILYQSEQGDIKFKPDIDAKPIYKFPHNKEDDLTGCPVIYETPNKISGHVPTGLYIICHDPYAHDKTTNSASLGAAYVIKRTNDFSSTFNECIVASYIARPETQDDYNRNLFMLAEYYNAKIGFENDRGDVIGYARRYKKLHLLERQFEFMDKKELQGNTKRSYGMNMTAERKKQGEIYLRDWLLTPIEVLEDGKKKLILHTIVDPALLQELIKFNHDGNFDRSMALIVGMYHIKEMYNKKVESIKKQKHEEFFNRFYQ
jgi:hypothetical protein